MIDFVYPDKMMRIKKTYRNVGNRSGNQWQDHPEKCMSVSDRSSE